MGDSPSIPAKPDWFANEEEVKNKQIATFGAGCYWGTEKYFRVNFGKQFPGGLISTAVGFMGDKSAKKNPSYREVCSGSTGHVEVLQIEYDGDKVPFEEMVKFFYAFHDPTTANRQGNDTGPQYASAIFCHSKEQEEIARKVTNDLQALIDGNRLKYKGVYTHTFAGQSFAFSNPQVSTAIRPADVFYPAHEEHQDYLNKNPGGYCNHRFRFSWEESI